MVTTNYYAGYDIKSEKDGFLYIGYVIQCNIGDGFGVIGYNQNYKNKTWLYYFPKKEATCYKKNSIVTFIKDSYEEKQPYEIACVYPIERYTILNIDGRGRKISQKIREDGCFHCDLEWKHMVQGIPFIIKKDECWISVMFPVVNDAEKSIYYLETSILGYTQDHIDKHYYFPISLLSCYIESKELRPIGTLSFFEYVSGELEKIKEYILKFNLIDNLSLYIAGTEGFFKNYPGRDDSFFTLKYWYSFCKDPYLNQLTNLHEEKNYYNCQGRGQGERDYDIIDQEETDRMRKEIKEKYDRDEHYSFLVNKLLSDIPSLKKRWEFATGSLTTYLTPYNKRVVDMEFGNDYVETIVNLNKNNS